MFGQHPNLDYSVLELYLDENRRGDGTLSLVAGVTLDAATATVSLDAAGYSIRNE